MKFDLTVILRLFNNFMAFVYVITGAFLIFSDIGFLSTNKTYKVILGVMLLIYGFYRIYRAFHAIRVQNEN